MSRLTIRSNKTNIPIPGVEFDYHHFASSYLSAHDLRKTHYVHDSEWRYGKETGLDLSQFGFSSIPDHFLTIDEDTAGDTVYVLYYASEKDGVQDRHTRTKLGRYLREFYPHLTSDEVTSSTANITTKLCNYELHFAYSADEIVSIYEDCEGTSAESCMTHPTDHWDLDGHHPVEAYAGPDLALAYLTRPGTGELIARSIVWPEKKIYVSIYGQYDRMRSALTNAGYRQDTLDGARLSKVKISGEDDFDFFICPYLDCGSNVREDEEYLIIDRKNGTCASSTDGCVRFKRIICHISSSRISSANAITVREPRDGGGVFIDKQYGNSDYIDVMPDGSVYLKSDDVDAYVIVASGERLPRFYVYDNYVRCAHTNKYFLFSEVMYAGNYEYINYKTYYELYALCEVTRETYLRTQMVWMEHKAWWHHRAFLNHGVVVDGKNYAKAIMQEAA